jgi:hypothetical protein
MLLKGGLIMGYLIFSGIIIIAFIANFLIAALFMANSKNEVEEYEHKLIDKYKNIILYSFAGLACLFLGNLLNNWISYIIFGIGAILLLIKIILLLIMFVTTLISTFKKNHYGFYGTGKSATGFCSYPVLSRTL